MSLGLEKVEELFEFWNDQYGEFDLIENKFSKKRDLHAFILLDKLFPDLDDDIVGSTGHEEFYIGIDMEDFAKVATEEIIIDLLRCGVLYDESDECLMMMV